MSINLSESLSLMSDYASKTDSSFGRLFKAFAMEDFLYKSYLSGFYHFFILKGQFLVSELSEFNGRFTDNIDLLLHIDTPLIDNVSDIISKMFSLTEGITFFDMKISKAEMTSSEIFHYGIKMTIDASLDDLNTKFDVNVGSAGLVFPKPQLTEIKTFITKSSDIKCLASTAETLIADKLADIAMGFCNIKNIYDIYYIAKKFELNSSILQEAIFKNFQQHNADFSMIASSNLISKILTDENDAALKKFLIDNSLENTEISNVADVIFQKVIPVCDNILSYEDYIYLGNIYPQSSYLWDNIRM